jgi:hypothetical protein
MHNLSKVNNKICYKNNNFPLPMIFLNKYFFTRNSVLRNEEDDFLGLVFDAVNAICQNKTERTATNMLQTTGKTQL